MRRLLTIVVIGVVGIVVFFALIASLLVATTLMPDPRAQQIHQCYSHSRAQLVSGVKLGGGVSAQQYFGQFSSGDLKERQKNARLIVAIGLERSLSARTIQIAVATAIQESGLRNLMFGDRDSLGLYQQRPSQGWGTAEQITNPVYAINTFYDALVKVEDRDRRPMIEVAMEVQRPDPFYYRRDWQWDRVAKDIVLGALKDAPVGKLPGAVDKRANSCVNRLSANSDGKWQPPLPPSSYTKTSPFGQRLDPITGALLLHNGSDMAAPRGTPIYAVASGVVTPQTGWQMLGGNTTFINHGNGVQTGYAHQAKIAPGIAPGTKVKAGEVIGFVGSTGHSTGNHLHFMVLMDGSEVRPLEFMRKRGVPL